MPIFVSHHYFQRTSEWRDAASMPCKCTVARLPAGHASDACAPVCTVMYILHHFYLPTRSLSLLEIYLPRGLHKWKNIFTYVYANAPILSSFVFRASDFKKDI